MSSAAPVVDRIRIIPRPSDFLDRNVGSSGEVFFNRETNSLRVYSGKDSGGFELAKVDLTNISNTDFLSKAAEAGIVSESGSVVWDDVQDKPAFATVATSGSYNDLSETPDLTSYATQTYVNNLVSATKTQQFSFDVAADDSTQVAINSGETLQIEGGNGISTTVDVEGKITINSTQASSTTFENLAESQTASLTIDKIYEPAIAMLRVDNVGVSAYTFTSHYSGNNPTIYAIAGTTIAFDLDSIPGLPFEIQDNTLSPYSIGLVHVASDGTVSIGASAQGKSSGTLYWRIREDEGGTYVYQCQTEASMFGVISVKRLSII